MTHSLKGDETHPRHNVVDESQLDTSVALVFTPLWPNWVQCLYLVRL
jgi:hypothetical protein